MADEQRSQVCQLKMRLYAMHGLTNLWLIDPIAQTLESYRLEGGRWVLLATHGGDDTAAIEPFEVVPLALSELWADRSFKGGISCL